VHEPGHAGCHVDADPHGFGGCLAQQELGGHRRPGPVGVGVGQLQAVQAGAGARFDQRADVHLAVAEHHRQVRDVAAQPPAVPFRLQHEVADQHGQVRVGARRRRAEAKVAE